MSRFARDVDCPTRVAIGLFTYASELVKIVSLEHVESVLVGRADTTRDTDKCR